MEGTAFADALVVELQWTRVRLAALERMETKLRSMKELIESSSSGTLTTAEHAAVTQQLRKLACDVHELDVLSQPI